MPVRMYAVEMIKNTGRLNGDPYTKLATNGDLREGREPFSSEASQAEKPRAKQQQSRWFRSWAVGQKFLRTVRTGQIIGSNNSKTRKIERLFSARGIPGKRIGIPRCRARGVAARAGRRRRKQCPQCKIDVAGLSGIRGELRKEPSSFVVLLSIRRAKTGVAEIGERGDVPTPTFTNGDFVAEIIAHDGKCRLVVDAEIVRCDIDATLVRAADAGDLYVD